MDGLAGYGKPELQRLMTDAAIVRNRAKIEATIANAAAIQRLHSKGETLTDLMRVHRADHRLLDDGVGGDGQ